MSTTAAEYCVVCGDERQFRREQQPTEFKVRGEAIVLELPVKVCMGCGTVQEEGGLDPAELAFAEYRRRRRLLTPQQIREIRERYQLSQKSFAALLGMSEATINRYEGGGLQDPAHDSAIRAFRQPAFVREMLDLRGHLLSDWQRERVEEALAIALRQGHLAT